MSHTYSRTQALLKEFAESTSSADIIILNKIYSSARENASDFEITGKTLYDETVKYNKSLGKDTDSCIFYYDDFMDAVDLVKNEICKPVTNEYPDGYLFVTMGAGDNWKLGKALGC